LPGLRPWRFGVGVHPAGWLFFAGAWLIILMGYLGIVALVGFYDTELTKPLSIRNMMVVIAATRQCEAEEVAAITKRS
jgi:hypothetical protein